MRRMSALPPRTGSIERACRKAGYEPPVICTPNDLMEEYDHADKTAGPNYR